MKGYNVFPYIKKKETGELDSDFHVLIYEDLVRKIIQIQETLWNYEPWKIEVPNSDSYHYINKEELVERYLQQITSKILDCYQKSVFTYANYMTGGRLDWPIPIRYFNLGLKKDGRYQLLYMISREQLSQEQKDSKYWKLLNNQIQKKKDDIVKFMKDNDYDYLAFKVDDADFRMQINGCDSKKVLNINEKIEPVDFYENDLCRMYINLEKITKNVIDSANYKHIANDNDNITRLPACIKSIDDDEARLLKVKDIVEDAIFRLKKNPRLAIPYGINKDNKEFNVRSQFLIPAFEDQNATRPFGALVARCTVSESETKMKSAIGCPHNIAEFSSCSYDFPTLLTLEMALKNSLAYVNLDKNIWCNVRKQEENEL